MEGTLNLILNKIESIDSRLGNMEIEAKNEFKQVNTRLENLETDVKSFKTEVRKEFKQVDSRFEKIDRQFEQVDSRFNHLETEIHRNRFLLEAAMNSQYAEMTRKQDKILSVVVNFAGRTEKVEEEITILAHRQREHEDRITKLEEKVL